MDDLLLLLTVLLLSASQILQKLGADRRLRGAHGARQWLAGLMSPEIALAAALIVAGAALWLCVLYRMDVSRAFPLLSLGSILVVAVSRIGLHEPVSGYRWAGVVLIVIGVALVGGT